MNEIMNNLPSILGFIALTLFVFILIREVICWYFKINERVQLQKDTIVNQHKIINLIQIGNQYLSEQCADKIFNNDRR